jgi:hypothetical protein
VIDYIGWLRGHEKPHLHGRKATEAEALAAYGLTVEVHCDACHVEAEHGLGNAMEARLPDGRVARVCCTAARLILNAGGQVK